MRSAFFSICLFIASLVLPNIGIAYELVMVERDGCHYCIRWKNDIGPIYPKSEAGQFAPIRHIDIGDTRGVNGVYKTPVIYTPTFILMKDGVEVTRMEGYASEDFFWGVLEMTLERETEFRATK